MFLKVVLCAALVAFVKSDELSDLTKSMRASIEWISKNTKYDKNSSIILGTAAGSLLKQGEDINTQVNLGYTELILALSRESLPEDPEAIQFFNATQLTALPDISADNKMSDSLQNATIYNIYECSQPTPAYITCLNEFYTDNPKPKSPPSPCVFSNPECLDILTKATSGTAVDLRNRFTFMTEKLSKCTDLNSNYDELIQGQMEELSSQINSMLESANSPDGLDPAFRYVFMRKVILMALSGYNSLTPEILKYLQTWVQSDGSCGLPSDDVTTKVMLSTQCYTIWTFRRQLILSQNLSN